MRDWNTLVESIPSGWVAVAAGYRERPFFQLDDRRARAPRVSFDVVGRPLEPRKRRRRPAPAGLKSRRKGSRRAKISLDSTQRFPAAIACSSRLIGQRVGVGLRPG